MDDHKGNLHNLRVLNFSALNENKSYDLTNLNYKECDESKTHNSFNKYAKSIKARSISDNVSESRPPTKNNKLGTKAFRRVFNKSSLTTPHHKRSVSLHDLKQNISLNSLEFSNKTRHRVRSPVFQTFSRHNRRKNVDVPNKDKNFQVLFKSKRNCSAQMRKRNIDKEFQRLDFLYDSKSSGDLFGFQSKHFYNPKFCYRLFKRHCKRNIQSCECNKKSSHIRLKSECGKKYEIERIIRNGDTYDHTMPVHYNLVNFPCSIQPCGCDGLTAGKKFVRKVDTTDLCQCVHEQVSVTPSCFAINKKGAGDSGIISRCVVVPNVEIQNESHNCIQRNHHKFNRKQHKSTKHRKPKFLLLTFDLSKNLVSLAKSTLKYILFGLAVIVWSPCLIAIGLYWLIIYPLKPQYILNATDLEGKNAYKKCGSCYICRHDFLHYIFKGCVRLARRVCYLYKAFFHLLKKQKQARLVCLKPCLSREFSKRRLSKRRQKNYPNQKNKYTLYYTRHRGWIIKPIPRYRKNFNKDCQRETIEDEEKTSKTCKEIHNKHFENEKRDKDKREHDCRCRRNEIQKDKKNTEKKDKDCECHTYETKPDVKLKPPWKHSTAKSIQKIKLHPKSHISKRILQNNSPDQKSVEEKLSKKLSHERKDRESSHIRKLSTPSIRAPKQETFNSSATKYNKNLSFKYMDTYHPCNALSYHFNKHDRCFNKLYCTGQHLDKIRKINKSCPHAYKNTIQKISKRPMVCIKKKVPRKVNLKKYKSMVQKVSCRRRLCCWCKTFQQNVRNVINDVEGRAWKWDICDDMFVYTLRKRPCFWIYKYCPSFYPYFLMFYKFYENVVYAMMFIVSACIWVPLLCWCYFCYTLFCRCIC